MEDVRITVGLSDADIVGTDHRALQAAVDYVAGLGGGVVEIGPGTFLMEDSLHVRSHVTVRGQGEDTILHKCDSHRSRLVLDGDYGEEQVTVAEPSGFKVGMGLTVADEKAGGFHTTVATIIGAEGDTFRLNKPLLADCMVARDAFAQSTFPVISGYYLEDACVERLAIEGNKANNAHLNGCRGAGIFLYRAHRVHIVDCTVRNYHGDGISFQQSNDGVVKQCVCHGNTHLGLHPGSGSQRPVIRDCRTFQNDQIGLFLCWRVRHGVFEGNEIHDNGEIGISIGHKDSDNLFRNNTVTGNGRYGIYFRDETEPMGGHRNRLEHNRIEDNGNDKEGYGIYIDGETCDTLIVNNTIGNAIEPKRQRVGLYIGAKAKGTVYEGNVMEGHADGDVQRASKDG